MEIVSLIARLSGAPANELVPAANDVFGQTEPATAVTNEFALLISGGELNLTRKLSPDHDKALIDGKSDLLNGDAQTAPGVAPNANAAAIISLPISAVIIQGQKYLDDVSITDQADHAGSSIEQEAPSRSAENPKAPGLAVSTLAAQILAAPEDTSAAPVQSAREQLRAVNPERASTPAPANVAVEMSAPANFLADIDRHPGVQLSTQAIGVQQANAPVGELGRISKSVRLQRVEARPPETSHASDRVFTVVSVKQSRSGFFELRLDPPGLGAVRIAFSPEESGAIRALVTADRADTLDLVRRHIDVFRAEAGSHGLNDLDFRFESGPQSRGGYDPERKKQSASQRESFATGFDGDAIYSVPQNGGMDVLA